MATETENETGTETERKTRAREYAVEYRSGDMKQWDTAGLDDTAAGMRWIRNNGVPGKTYRVVRICAGPVTVKVEKVEKRTLA